MTATTKHVLVTGGTGQVGLEIAALDWPEGFALHLPTRAELDLSSGAGIEAYLSGREWAGIINCAAWTAVDNAESRVGEAWAANAQGPAWLADGAARRGLPLVHVSTDYVFAGDLDRPYREDDPTGPKGVYGASKLGGELAVLTGNPRSVALRTAWVQSRHRANFVKTMLRLAETRDTLGVVADQHGCPTSAGDIARALQTILLRMIDDPQAPAGVYHFVNGGAATWADLAEFVFERSARHDGPSATVQRIATDQYPTPARRPANSRLATEAIARDFGIAPRDWRAAMGEVIDQIFADLAEARAMEGVQS